MTTHCGRCRAFSCSVVRERRRQNLGRTRTRGLELEAETRLSPHLTRSVGYLLAEAEVTRFPANIILEGLRIPQVARRQLTFQMRYANPTLINVGVQARLMGTAFDDDQNRLPLAPYFTLDALGSRHIARGLDAFAAAENLLNARYEIGRTPVTTNGPPRLARFGLRLQFGAR